MSRMSKKDQILEASLDIIASDGIPGVTYDRLATVTGLSKSGLIYHFPSRHDLLVGLHEFTAARWEKKIIDHAGGKTADELTERERYRAMLVTMSEHEPVTELLVTLHARTHEDFARPWVEVEDRWLPDVHTPSTDKNLVAATVLASGLWAHDHIYVKPLAPENRKVVVEKLLELLEI
ncbi:TetR family transcriptional regulator [Corynebacterium renale]|uniref:TetR family transcriptional regulator n=2 Tax=Corynebacterium renale TaxID=1724 RepID=A0A2A9DM81_9CORY|nr:TetR family transcriptional regulator [Corynebacterium renale]SQI22072.1 TetR family transcriptional regulator [Corynebacterium renale]